MSVFDVMADHMNCKTDQIRAAWHAGDRIGALRIAARFFDRSIAAALELLAKKFNLQRRCS